MFVNQFYHPDVAATGQHLRDLAEFLAGRGHAVSVFATLTPYAEGRTGTPPATERHNGVMVRRFRGTAFGRRTHIGRILDYLSFYLQVAAVILFGRRHDAVIFLTTPPLIAVIGLVTGIIRGQRYAIWSMDLHPAAETAAGMLRSESIAARALRVLWRVAHNRAGLVVALGTFMRDRIAADGGSLERLEVVPPWSTCLDVDRGGPNPLRRKLGLEGRFVVMYSGNAGLVHDFTAIFEAIRILKDDRRFFFLFVGAGPRRADIEAFARAEGLENFTYHDYFERDDVASSLSVGDAHLVCLRANFAGISVPSKLYGIMAAGRPALFVGPIACESADTIMRADCGVVVDSEDARAGSVVVEALRRWSADSEECERLGSNGARAFLREYELSANCSRFAALLESHFGPVSAAGT